MIRINSKGRVLMDTIYVTGHRNPDTDSIVSAMAYAGLQRAMGSSGYVAACHWHNDFEMLTVPEGMSRLVGATA